MYIVLQIAVSYCAFSGICGIYILTAIGWNCSKFCTHMLLLKIYGESILVLITQKEVMISFVYRNISNRIHNRLMQFLSFFVIMLKAFWYFQPHCFHFNVNLNWITEYYTYFSFSKHCSLCYFLQYRNTPNFILKIDD